MESAKSQPPFYEQRWFQGAVAIIGLLTAVWALIGAPKPWSVADDLTRNELPLANTQIVLDTSAAMEKPFGEGTKLDAATDAIAKFAASSNSSGLALRQTGGGCYDDGDVVVGFGSHHGDDVREATEDMQTGGASNVINTVRGAIDEFTGREFRDASSMRRIVVFMGGEDSCVEAAGEEVSDALDGMGVDTTFRMYGLGMSRHEMKDMNRFVAEVEPYAKVEFWPVEDEKELVDAVDQEAKEISAGEVPDAEGIVGPEIDDEGAGGAQAQGIAPIDPEEATETTPETEEPTEPPPGEEPPEVEPPEEAVEEEAPPEATTPSGPAVGSVPGGLLYAVNRTGSVFSWLRKADSVNLGLPAMLMFG